MGQLAISPALQKAPNPGVSAPSRLWRECPSAVAFGLGARQGGGGLEGTREGGTPCVGNLPQARALGPAGTQGLLTEKGKQNSYST